MSERQFILSPAPTPAEIKPDAQLHESLKRYLLSVYALTQEQGYARAVDVGKRLGFSGASVSRAVHILQDGGWLKQDPNRFLLLTAEGSAFAQRILDRRAILEAYLRAIGTDEPTASEDACKLEHDLSDEAFQAICRQLDDLKSTSPSFAR